MTTNSYGRDFCIDCGELTDCLLPSRFPHICRTCLFPPPPKHDDARSPSEVPDVFGLVDDLSPIERLYMRRSNGVFRGGKETFGKGLPEKFNRRGGPNV